jgi:PrtD family type I secretion system ABC transporter
MRKLVQPWLQPIVAPLQSVFRELLLISFFVNALALAVPVFIQQVYDRVVAHQGISTLKGLVIGMALLLCFDFVLRQTRARILQLVALKIDIEVGEMLFDKVLALPLRTLESRPAAFWQQLFRDVDMIRNTLSGATALLFIDLPFIVLFLVVIFIVAEPVAWVFLCVFPAFLWLAWRSGSSLQAATTTERSRQGNRDTLLAEVIAGRTTIKALALDRSVRPMWEERQASTIEQSMIRGSRSDGFVNLANLFTLGTNVTMTSVGATFIIDQKLTMGGLIAANMLVSRLLSPLNQLVGAWRTYASFRQAMERIGKVLIEDEDRRHSTVKMGRPTGAVAIEDTSFSYDPRANPVLDGISLSIPAGGITAVLGRNGAGKTTFLKLLQGLYKPSQGRVLIDGADLAQFTRHEIAGWMGYVPQECVLFTGTIRDNIAQGMDDATDEDILHAATLAGVHQYIVDLPNGYGTEIGEAGSRLSAGQRQRIALARALIGDPPVLLLDEPSASLDRQAEESLRDILANLGRDHTIIMVTHSGVLLPVCRNVVLLDHSKIAAAGPAGELLPKLFPASRPAAAASLVPAPQPQPTEAR